jgi:hypothetical protein
MASLAHIERMHTLLSQITAINRHNIVRQNADENSLGDDFSHTYDFILAKARFIAANLADVGNAYAERSFFTLSAVVEVLEAIAGSDNATYIHNSKRWHSNIQTNLAELKNAWPFFASAKTKTTDVETLEDVISKLDDLREVISSTTKLERE